eukprot:c18724_g1_i2.p1 GENE.c18724_g1_i2~~c18724_g1_i2.p1  ORF type:complete len:445 (-),score=87.76 c18724_g1_i2:95-1429(-)
MLNKILECGSWRRRGAKRTDNASCKLKCWTRSKTSRDSFTKRGTEPSKPSEWRTRRCNNCKSPTQSSHIPEREFETPKFEYYFLFFLLFFVLFWVVVVFNCRLVFFRAGSGDLALYEKELEATQQALEASQIKCISYTRQMVEKDSQIKQLTEALRSAPQQSSDIAALRSQLQEVQHKLDQEVLRNTKVLVPMVDKDVKPAPLYPVHSDAGALSRENTRLRDQLEAVELKYTSVRELVENAIQERDQSLAKLDEFQRRADEKYEELEKELRRTQNEAIEARLKLVTLRRETDSLRPKATTLESLQPMVDRLQAQVEEQRETIKQLAQANEELTAKQQAMTPRARPKPQANSNSSTPSQSPNAQSLTPRRVVRTNTTSSQQSPKNLNSPEPRSFDEETYAADSSWLEDAQGLLQKIYQTSDQIASTQPMTTRARSESNDPGSTQG